MEKINVKIRRPDEPEWVSIGQIEKAEAYVAVATNKLQMELDDARSTIEMMEIQNRETSERIEKLLARPVKNAKRVQFLELKVKRLTKKLVENGISAK